MLHLTAWTLLLVQSLVGSLPPIHACCLIFSGDGAAATVTKACCDDCREPSPAPASNRCECSVERLPAAVRSDEAKTPPVDAIAWFGLPESSNHFPARVAVGNVSVRSEDVPDIPVRILFCTWLE